MAKVKHLRHSSDIGLPSSGEEELGQPIEELKKQDYSALSNTLVRKGEFRLLHGDRSGLEFFEMALKLDPLNPRLYIEVGLALFEYGSHEGNENELVLASRRFKRATSLDPTDFEAWHIWGNTLYFLGMRRAEPSYFLNARKKYDRALSLCSGQPSDVLADLYWDSGDIWTKLAEISEEPSDYHEAIKAYERATTFHGDLPTEFWVNFASATFTLGKKTNDLRLLIKAINTYKKAISIDISSSEGWFKLALALQTLYSITHDDDHFSQADECYATATQLSNVGKGVYLEWARLLLESGSTFHDVKKLRACAEKCQLAHRYDTSDPYVMGVWAEALALIGVLTDRIKSLHDAQKKINPLVEKYEDPEILYSHGRVLHALGVYYNDSDYFFQATESFQEGLSLDRTHHKLWYGIGRSSFASAMIDQDERSFERSCRFFKRALNLQVSSTTHCHYAISLSKYGELIQDQETLELSLYHFDSALNMQKNAAYHHPDWLFHCACALDHLAGFIESDSHYQRALELLNHVLAVKPEFPAIHYRMALVYSHYAELTNEPELFERAIHHFRIAHQRERENDQIILDWSLTLVNLGDLLESDVESDHYFREAEYKMIKAAKLGNVNAYYSLACLYSLLGDLESSLRFLDRAKSFDGLPIIEEILEDEWLENVMETEGFNSFLAKLQQSANT
ncbi:MAG: hypothetical protein K1060chlam2_00109 [Chlamydiae bacterium]|nr:hypothetical protein [Chlamydiota bacterium]